MYTQQTLEYACRTVLGPQVYDSLIELDHPITMIHGLAVQKAFIEELHGDDVEILRTAMIDLTKKGVYRYSIN